MYFIGRAPGFRVWFTIMSLGTRAVGFKVPLWGSGLKFKMRAYVTTWP